MVATIFIRIFVFNIKMNIVRTIQYRADFLINVFLAMAFSSVAPIVQFLIFTKTKGYPGWTLDQIILFQGCLLLWGGIKNTLFGQIKFKMNQFVQKGLLDRLLLKPYPVIASILSDGFQIASIGTIIAGAAIILYSLDKMKIDLTAFQILLFLYVYILGMTFYISVLILFCSINVLVVFIGRLGDILDKLLQFSEYPIEIFPKTGRVLFVTFAPIAVWIYFPSQILLNRIEFASLIGLSFFCILSFFISLLFWDFTLKKYTSAGG